MKTIQPAMFLVMIMSILMECKKDYPISNADPFTSVTAADAKLDWTVLDKWIKPEHFVEGINNEFLPMVPGDTAFFTTVSVENGETIVEDVYVAVTHDIKVIQGISCEVIHDVVMEDGIITEDTYDWFAQDIKGNVFYFGEDTKKLQEDGSWDTEGSFEAGVDGAEAGIVMAFNPKKVVGMEYRQEYYVGHAQDKAKVTATNETVTIAYGTFKHCVKTEETTVLDPGVIEYKWYAPGIGLVMASISIGGDEHEELIGMVP